MILTNKLGLPSGFVNSAKSEHEIKPKHYSATTLLRPTRQILLERRHDNEIVDDVANRVWMIFGTAIHKVLENNDKTGYAEVKMQEVIKDDYILTGIMDLYNESLQSIEDYKSTVVWKIINKDFEDWRKQGLIYAWLARKKGLHVGKLRFHALLKDWSPAEYKKAKYSNKFYPEHPVWTWEHEITEDEMIEIEAFIKKRFDELIKAEKLSDKDLPLCTNEERWNTGDKYAVFLKVGQKKASKVFSDEQEAHDFISNNGGAGSIEVRKGEDKRCEHYCQCCMFCDHYLNSHKEVAEDKKEDD